MALTAMASHKLRTFLTMLGIIIGIASVVSVVALGQGSQQRVLKNISAIGTNVIDIFPGEDFGDRRSGNIHSLKPSDTDVLAQQSYVDSVTPKVSTSVDLRYRNVDVDASVSGVNGQYFRVQGYEMAQGRSFDSKMIREISQVAVIDQNTLKRLFGEKKQAVGKVLILGSVPCRIIGVTKKKQSFFGNRDSLNVWGTLYHGHVPYAGTILPCRALPYGSRMVSPCRLRKRVFRICLPDGISSRIFLS